MSADPSKKIMQQIEYYFGNLNLPRDKFLQEEMKKENGWIPLTTMLKFKRLAALTTDIDTITASLRESSLIEVSEEDQKIRRNPEVPLPENTLEYWQEIKRRTIYLKGFPQDVTLDEIAEFVGQFGTVENILMRKTKGGKATTRIFKGSAFVTYANVEQAKHAAAQKDLKFKGEHELVNKMQEEYWASKYNERQQNKELKKQMKKTQIEQQNKAHYRKGMVMKLTGLKPEMAAAAEEATTTTSANADAETAAKNAKKEPKQDIELVDELKSFFQPYGQAAFVIIDGNEATIRFMGDEDAAKDALQKAAEASNADGKIVVDGVALTAALLEGEEEAKYWAEFNKAKASKSQKGPHRRGGKDHRKTGESYKIDRQARKRRADKGTGHMPTGPTGKRTVFNDDNDEELAEQNGGRDEKPAVNNSEKEEVEAKKPKVEEPQA